MRRRIFESIIILTILTTLGISCSDSNSEQTTQPELPPIESLTLTFDGLPVDNNQFKSVQTDTAAVRAFIAATTMKVIFESNAAFPKILLQAARNTSPTLNDDGEWVWEYSASGPAGSSSVRLVAQSSDETVNWGFYVSVNNQETQWDDVLLVNGSSDLDGNSGIWNIYIPQTQNILSTTTWQIEENDEEVMMSIYDQAGTDISQSLTYVLEGNEKTVTLDNFEANSRKVLHWNVETGAGYFISPELLNGDPVCWDENFQDKLCD